MLEKEQIVKVLTLYDFKILCVKLTLLNGSNRIITFRLHIIF